MKEAIEKYLSDNYGYSPIEEPNLSLYGFTNVQEINGIPVALRTSKGATFEICFYRVLDRIHYKHINKLNVLRKRMNEKEYKYGRVGESREEYEKKIDKCQVVFRRLHTEVYTR